MGAPGATDQDRRLEEGGGMEEPRAVGGNEAQGPLDAAGDTQARGWVTEGA